MDSVSPFPDSRASKVEHAHHLVGRKWGKPRQREEDQQHGKGDARQVSSWARHQGSSCQCSVQMDLLSQAEYTKE